MAWERRPYGGPYFYRSRRIGGEVVKEYVGKGPKADAAAREIASRRKTNLSQRQAVEAALRRMQPAWTTMVALSEEADALVHSAMILGGYYLQHRTWRRRRGQ